MQTSSEESLNSESHSTTVLGDAHPLETFHCPVGQNRRGTSVDELRVHIRNQQREQERQKAIEAEARSAEHKLKEQDVQHASSSQAHRPLGSSIRKDSSPIKVPYTSFEFCSQVVDQQVVDSLYPEYSTQIFYYRNPTQRNRSLPCGQPSTPHGRVALVAVLSAHLFRARHMTHCSALLSVTPSLSSLFLGRPVGSIRMTTSRRRRMNFIFSNGTFITLRLHLVPSIPSPRKKCHLKAVNIRTLA